MQNTIGGLIEKLKKPKREGPTCWPGSKETITPRFERIPEKLLNCLVTAIQKEYWPIYIYSEKPGAGKTSAAAWLYMCSDAPQSPWFCKCQWMIDEYLGGFELGFTSQKTRIRNTLNHAGLVVIDEIGTKKLKENQAEALLDMLEFRMGKKTIYTGNKTPEQLEGLIGPRCVSRICCGAVIECTGHDLRTEKAVKFKA